MADKKISALTAASLPLAGTEVLPIVQSSATVKVATDDLTVKNIRSNATTGILQIAGPGAGATRTMTTPNANFTAARTDAAQTFTGIQSFAGSTQNVRVYGGSAAHQWDIYGNGNNLRVSDNTGGGFVQFDTDVNMNGGNLIQGTAAKGVNFTANTPAAGMTSQLLNWYEEGTWTPSLGGNTTYITQSGTYTRIGRMVFIRGILVINAIGTGSTTQISGLPFANASGSVIPVSVGSYFASATAVVSFFASISNGGSVINVSSLTAAATTEASNPIFQNSTQFQFSACYSV